MQDLKEKNAELQEALEEAKLVIRAWRARSLPEQFLELRKQRGELLEALREAKLVIRTWHGEAAWDAYDQASPEMKRINAAIAKARGA